MSEAPKGRTPKPRRIEGVRQKTPGSGKAQLVSTLDQEADLPIAATLNEFLLQNRRFVGAFVGNGGSGPEDAGYRAPTFHMSGGGCTRKELLEWSGAPKLPENPTSLRRFATGHLVESLLETAVRERGMLVCSQLRVWRDWTFRAGKGHRESTLGVRWDKPPRLILDDCLVSGTLDAILAWKRGGKWRVWIVDWKTVDVRRFFKVDQAIDKGYATQLAGYAATAEEQHGDMIRRRLADMGVERDPKGPLFDGARLIYASVGGPIQIAQVGVNLEQWIPEARARWRRVRDGAEAYRDNGALPPELAMDEKGEPPWNCNPMYCRFAVARKKDGTFICPTVGAFWEKRVMEVQAKGKDAEWPGRALRLSAIMHDFSDEAKAEEAVIQGASPEAVEAEIEAVSETEPEAEAAPAADAPAGEAPAAEGTGTTTEEPPEAPEPEAPAAPTKEG